MGGGGSGVRGGVDGPEARVVDLHLGLTPAGLLDGGLQVGQGVRAWDLDREVGRKELQRNRAVFQGGEAPAVARLDDGIAVVRRFERYGSMVSSFSAGEAGTRAGQRAGCGRSGSSVQLRFDASLYRPELLP
jgi:hypothetical protein